MAEAERDGGLNRYRDMDEQSDRADMHQRPSQKSERDGPVTALEVRAKEERRETGERSCSSLLCRSQAGFGRAKGAGRGSPRSTAVSPDFLSYTLRETWLLGLKIGFIGRSTLTV